MPFRVPFRRLALLVALLVGAAVAGPPSSASGGGLVSPGLPEDTGTAVSPVAATTISLEAVGVAPLPVPIGFGAATTGGAGGRLLHVTHAADSLINPPVGSLRWAVQQPGAKWIVFDRDMTVALAGPLAVTSNTTIDGRGRRVTISAPGHTGIEVHDSTNVVLESLTLRDFGDPSRTVTNDTGDAINLERASRVWIDHCSLSRAGDKLISVADGVRELTISSNHFSEQEQTLQIGALATANTDVHSTATLAFNHFDHVGLRQPVVAYGKAHVVNNFIDSWLVSAVRSERLAQVYVENNVFRAAFAPKATIVTPAQTCNDSGTRCDDRAGYLLDTGNLFYGKTSVESTGVVHMFDPSQAYDYSAAVASTELAAVIAAEAGALDTGVAAAPPASQPTTRLQAKNVKAGRDRLKIATAGAWLSGAAAAIWRRTGNRGGWTEVKLVRLDERGRARVNLNDNGKGTVASYVVVVAPTSSSLESRSNEVAVR